MKDIIFNWDEQLQDYNKALKEFGSFVTFLAKARMKKNEEGTCDYYYDDYVKLVKFANL